MGIDSILTMYDSIQDILNQLKIFLKGKIRPSDCYHVDVYQAGANTAYAECLEKIKQIEKDLEKDTTI